MRVFFSSRQPVTGPTLNWVPAAALPFTDDLHLTLVQRQPTARLLRGIVRACPLAWVTA